MPTLNRKAIFTTAVSGISLTILASCGGPDGRKAPENMNPPGDSIEKTSLSSMLPCESLTREQEHDIRTQDTGTPKEIGNAKSCRWNLPEGALSVTFHADKSIKEINLSSGEKKTFKINQKEGVIATGISEGSCTAAIPANSAETVTIDAVGNNDTESCDLVRNVAPMVEKNISEN
ncbi:DUF3558 family protein [Actinopolyspora mortivallis]|uniref:DUF3558 family protein n=1 Tax=Actinopolyspora mortivallis TaxID=33906 RepID=UPI0012EE9EA2|nr:DUF3558 family protein [Actinopolyspora mortivallis]